MSDIKNPFEMNMELWEKMSGNYMDAMFKAMEKTMEQSTAFKKQLDQSVTTAVNMQFETTLTTLHALERQVEALSAKVDQLLKEKS